MTRTPLAETPAARSLVLERRAVPASDDGEKRRLRACIAFLSSFDNVPVSLFPRAAATEMLPIRM
jgi:hypothetical protein